MTGTIPRRSLSIRARLLILGGVTIVLVVGLFVGLVVTDAHAQRRAAVERLLNVAEATAGTVGQVMAASGEAASRFADDAAVIVADSTLCGPWLGRARDVLPTFENVVLTDAPGIPVCSYRSGVVGNVDYGERPWFREVRAGRSAISEPLLDPRSHDWIVIFAAPVWRDPAEAPVGAVLFALGLDRIQPMVPAVSLPEGAVVTVASGGGVVVARSRDPALWVGDTLPPPVSPSAPLGDRGLVIEGTDFEGHRSLFARVDVPGTRWHAYARWSTAQAFAPAWTAALGWGSLAALLVLLTVAGAVWVYLPTTRSLRGLVEGAYAAALRREALPTVGPEEVQAVARGFNETLAALVDAEGEARKLARVVEQLGDPVFITDEKGVIEYVNPAWERATGYGIEEALGWTPQLLLASGETPPEVWGDLWQAVRDGTPHRTRLRNRKKDGTVYTDDTTVTPLRDPAGRITHVVVTGRDVTQEEELTERLRKGEKLEAMGQLAGGVAHDFNNLLTAITGYTELLNHGLEEDGSAELKSYAQEILKGARMAGSLTHQLLTFTRQDVAQAESVLINDVIERLATFLSRVIPSDVEVTKDLDPRARPVWIDPIHAEQIVLNLALNARDAMPGGGTLTLRTRSDASDVDPDDVWTVLEVQDTGVGIQAGEVERIFDPFYSTKPHGTGLGLATVRDVVSRAGGTVSVDTVPGEGSRFKVRLPTRGEVPAETGEAVPAAAEEAASSGRTVLLAEDNDAVRALLVRVLRGAGYQVIAASDGAAALRRARELAGPPDMVVTDVMMPVMKGPELLSELRRDHPSLPALFLSGYADVSLVGSFVNEAPTELLTKPVSPAQLRGTVARMLAMARASSPAGGAAGG